MDVDALRDSPVGQLIDINGTDPRTNREYAHFAFLPEPLPTEVHLSQATWAAVSEAAGALGMLRQACAYLPNPSLLIAPALYKEAQATSALEGTFGALPDVLQARLPGAKPKTPEIREINAYVDMAFYAFDAVAEDRPLSMALLCELQMILANGSKIPPPDPGRVRTSQVLIGPEGCTVFDARFIPPPGDDRLRSRIDGWETWLAADLGMPPIAKAALCHYQFEALHPFSDCNGRVGRLLIILQLLRTGLLASPSLTLSPWLLRRRRDYQDHLLSISVTGDWNPWVVFFCRAVQEQCSAHVDVASQLVSWQAELRREMNARNWSGVIVEVAESLVDRPIVTNRLVQDRFNVSAPTAKSATDRLVSLGVLTELSGRSHGRVFGAHQVMSLVDSL